MGLMDRILKNALPNATKCSTLHDIQVSHTATDRRVVIELEDIYGVMLIPSFGLGFALIGIIAERTWLKIGKWIKTSEENLPLSII